MDKDLNGVYLDTSTKTSTLMRSIASWYDTREWKKIPLLCRTAFSTTFYKVGPECLVTWQG